MPSIISTLIDGVATVTASIGDKTIALINQATGSHINQSNVVVAQSGDGAQSSEVNVEQTTGGVGGASTGGAAYTRAQQRAIDREAARVARVARLKEREEMRAARRRARLETARVESRATGRTDEIKVKLAEIERLVREIERLL